MDSFQFTSYCQTSASPLSNAEAALAVYIPQSCSSTRELAAIKGKEDRTANDHQWVYLDVDVGWAASRERVGCGRYDQVFGSCVNSVLLCNGNNSLRNPELWVGKVRASIWSNHPSKWAARWRSGFNNMQMVAG